MFAVLFSSHEILLEQNTNVKYYIKLHKSFLENGDRINLMKVKLMTVYTSCVRPPLEVGCTEHIVGEPGMARPHHTLQYKKDIGKI